MRILLLALAVAVALTACQPVDVAEQVRPRGGDHPETDIAYGTGPRQKVDFYWPKYIRRGSPIVVFVHGDGWRGGDKEDYRYVGRALAQRGYVTAIPNYRLYPEAAFPDFVEDVAAAVAWLTMGGERAGKDPRPVVLIGHEAGAHLAMLIALDRRYLAAYGVDVCEAVRGVVGLAGPYDTMPARNDAVDAIFPAATRDRSLPIAFADAKAPPTLLLTGDDDGAVDPQSSARLARRLAAAGTHVETRHYEEIGRIALVAAFAEALRGRAPVLDDVDTFIQRRSPDQIPYC